MAENTSNVAFVETEATEEEGYKKKRGRPPARGKQKEKKTKTNSPRSRTNPVVETTSETPNDIENTTTLPNDDNVKIASRELDNAFKEEIIKNIAFYEHILNLEEEKTSQVSEGERHGARLQKLKQTCICFNFRVQSRIKLQSYSVGKRQLFFRK
jgi:hypothetical protein